MRYAIVGSRKPTDNQKQYVQEIIAGMKADGTVVSGCADGIDAFALETAKARGLHTIGCIPWTSFKKKNQAFCDEIIDLSLVDEGLRQEAYESVRRYHPAKGGSKTGFLLHARNFIIIKGSEFVLACPSMSKGLGGTGQGIRLAIAYKIPFMAIGADGKQIINAEHYL